ncbi:hypothetical protein V2J09_007346 [Rumex salicifolius]
MDFHTMKRKELQALCKKHNIPANLKNLEMANRLASLLKIDDEKPKEQLVKPCLKNLEDLCVVDEEMGEGKEPKKVRFSPQNQTFVFEKTNPRAMRVAARRRNSMAIGGDKFSKEEVVSALEDGKEKRNGKTTVTRSTRQLKRDRGVDETVSAAEDAPIGDQCRTRRSARVAMKRSKVEDAQMNDKKSVVEVQDKTKEKAKGKSRVTCNGRQKRGRGVNEIVTATKDASIADQYLEKRTHILNDKKLGVKGQENRVSSRNKQPRKQENSDGQTRCVGNRKLSSMKHVEDLHTDSLAKSVDSADNSEVGDLVNSFCEVVDVQNTPRNDSSVDKDNQGKSQHLHQTKSPTPLLDECNSEKAVERSSEASILIKELTEEKDILNKESSSEKVVLTKQQEDSVFSSHEEGILLELYSSGGETTKEEDKEVGTDKEVVILNGQSKTSPMTVETVLLSSCRFKTSSPSAILTVLTSYTENSKVELESSDPKVDNTSIDKSEISLRVCETVFQGMNQPQLEGSLIKSTELEDRCAAAISINEQDQMTRTRSNLESALMEEGIIPDFSNLEGQISRDLMADAQSYPNINESATPKEEGIVPDFSNLEGQISRDGMADVKSYPNINEYQSRLQKPCDTLEMSMIVSNEPLDSQDDKCIDHLGKSRGYDYDTEGVTLTATANVNIECSEDIDTCISDREYFAESDINHKQGLEDLLNLQTIDEERNGIEAEKDSVVSSNVPEGRTMINVSDVELSDNHDADISDRSDYPAESDLNPKQGLVNGSNLQTIHEATEVVISNVPEERNIMDVSDVHLKFSHDTCISDSSEYPAESEINRQQGLEETNDSVEISIILEGRDLVDDVQNVQMNNNHEDAILADQNLEKGDKGGYIQEAAETTIAAMADDRAEIIFTSIGDITYDTPDCEKSHKQGFEKASNSQLSSGEESFGIATLFQSEYVEDERNVIGVSDVKLDKKTSPQSADIVLSPSSGLKTSPYRAISVSRSCSEGRKTELANSAAKFNSWIQSAPPLKSAPIEKLGISVPMCELGLQGTYHVHHETAIPSSMIVECEPHTEEVSSIKNSESEDQFSATISSNEQGQLNWTSSIVDSATPRENQSGDVSFILREGGIIPDLCNLVKHEPAVERTERSDGIDNYISAINHTHGVEEKTNSQTIHEDTNDIAAEKDSVVVGNDNHEDVHLNGNHEDVQQNDNYEDVHLNDNHEDADLTDQNTEVHFHEEKGRLKGCYQDADGVTCSALNKCPAESEINHKQEVLEEETNSQSFHKETNDIAAEKDNVVISNVHEERNMIDAQLIDNPEDLVKADQDLKVHKEKGNIFRYIQEAEAPTATIGERSESSHSPGDTTDCEKVHKQGLEPANYSQLSSGEESYGIATLFESEYAEDDDNVTDDEPKDDKLLEVFDVELDNNLRNEDMADENMGVYEEKGETCIETHEVSKRQGDVCQPIIWEEFGSNSQNKSAIVLQDSKEKLTIRSSVDEENENATFAESSATVELIGPSPGRIEPEEDFIGLAVLERTTEQTEQQSGNENFSFTHESEKSDGKNFSLTPEALGADGEPEGLLHPELSVTKMDDQSKSAYVKGICKQDQISSQLEMNPLNDEADKVENSYMKPKSMMNQNKRSILIHGTLRRPIKTADMKENSTLHLKRELNLGDATALRPMAKRRALQELHRK